MHCKMLYFGMYELALLNLKKLAKDQRASLLFNLYLTKKKCSQQ